MNIDNLLKNNSIKFFVVLLITLSLGLQSQAQKITYDETDFSTWNNLLQKHVNDKGEVDYRGFMEDESALKNFTNQLSQNSLQEDWSDNEKKAYLINAYNAFTIQLIIDNYPLKSIKDIGKEPFDAFKKKFISFGNRKVSLDGIEKGMLVPMGDPRVHFAVNCASYSCPKLSNKAYRPQQLDKQLDEVATRFINSDLNSIKESKIKLSKLFDWYRSDFETESQTLIDFINKYSETKIKTNAKLEYLVYDWSLNSK